MSSNSLRALRHTGFSLFWVASFVSNVGYAIQTVAQGWLVYRLTGSAAWLGAVAAGSTLPFLVFTPLGGVYADRWPRRQTMVILQSILMVCAAALAMLVHYDRVEPWHILVAAVVSGAATALYNPASQAIVKDLVGSDDLVSAVSLIIGQFQVSRALGPFCAAWVLTRASLATCFYANAASFVPFILVLACFVETPPMPARQTVQPPMFDALRAGLRVAVDDRSIRDVLLSSATVGLFLVPVLTLLPQLADRVYDIDREGLAELYALAGAGAAIGAFTTGMLAARLHWRSLLVAVTITGAASVAGVGMTRDTATGAALIAVSSYTVAVVWTLATATLHRITPDVYRGRVLSLNFLAFNLSVGIGNLALGWISGGFGPRTALIAWAAIGLAWIPIMKSCRARLE